MKQDAERRLAIDEELLTSIRLITAGLGQLQRLDGSNDFYHLPILSLASGFERFMKVILCFDRHQKTGAYPTQHELIPKGKKGHDLVYFLERIRSECFSGNYVHDIPAAKTDFEYLQSADLLRFVRILSDFGQSARYYDLDVVVGKKPSTNSPKSEWQALEMEILKTKGWIKEVIENPAANDAREKVNREIVVFLERLARALSRLFTIGRLGSEAKRYSGHLKPFISLMESDLGINSYSPIGIIN